jgi:hypothetical protein
MFVHLAFNQYLSNGVKKIEEIKDDLLRQDQQDAKADQAQRPPRQSRILRSRYSAPVCITSNVLRSSLNFLVVKVEKHSRFIRRVGL